MNQTDSIGSCIESYHGVRQMNLPDLPADAILSNEFAHIHHDIDFKGDNSHDFLAHSHLKLYSPRSHLGHEDAKPPSVSKIFQGSDLSNMEEFVEKMMKKNNDPLIEEEERNFPENAINFDEFSKMVSLPSDRRGSSRATMSQSSKKDGNEEVKMQDHFENEEMKQEAEMLEHLNAVQSEYSKMTETNKGKRVTKKQPLQKKLTLKTYSDLLAVLAMLEKFDWADESLNQPKLLPMKNMTPFSFWFVISGLHFSMSNHLNYSPKELFGRAVEQLDSIPISHSIRVMQPFSKGDEMEMPLTESQKSVFDQLFAAIKQANSQNKDLKSQIVPLSSRRVDSKPREQYTSEDDAWIISTRQSVRDFALHAQINLEDDLNVINKLPLDELVSIFEAELNTVCQENQKNLGNLEERLLCQVGVEQWKTELALPADDILSDLKWNIPEEEQYMVYLEKKQLEGKDLLKPGEPIRAPGNSKYKPRIALEDMVCHICNDGDYTDDDLIVFCAKCNISVHQTCYGINKIPKNDWICDVCQNFGAEGRYLRCPFCVKRGGAMKPTVMRADSNYFQYLNPDFHEFVSKYAHEERIRATKMLKKPSKMLKDLKKKKKKRVSKVDSASEDGNDSDSSCCSVESQYHQDENGQPTGKEIPHHKKRGRKPSKKETLEEEEDQDLEIPEITCDNVTELYYDFQYIDENYTAEDLVHEPRPERIWAHITCTLFTPELFFQDKDNISDIDGFSILSKERFKIECCICGQKRAGAIVNCEKNSCKKAFHPECARRAKLYLEIKESENGHALVYTMFCENHTPLKLRRTLESKEKKAREDIYKFCKTVERYYHYCTTNKKPPKKPQAIVKAADKQSGEKNKSTLKNNLLKKKNTDVDSSDLYLNLVEEWRKKVPSSLYTITLAKMRHTVKDDENQIIKEEMFKVIDTHVPRAYTGKKLAIGDEVWSHMPYKNYNPLQKYKKYKKIIMRMKTQENKEELNKYIKSTKRALRDEQKNLTTKSSSLLRDYHVVVEEPDENIYCICRQKYRADGTDDDMLACDTCGEWYHFGCVGFDQTLRRAKSVTWHCQKCKGVPFPKKNNSSIMAWLQKGRKPFGNKQNLPEPAPKKKVKQDSSKPK